MVDGDDDDDDDDDDEKKGEEKARLIIYLTNLLWVEAIMLSSSIWVGRWGGLWRTKTIDICMCVYVYMGVCIIIVSSPSVVDRLWHVVVYMCYYYNLLYENF